MDNSVISVIAIVFAAIAAALAFQGQKRIRALLQRLQASAEQMARLEIELRLKKDEQIESKGNSEKAGLETKKATRERAKKFRELEAQNVALNDSLSELTQARSKIETKLEQAETQNTALIAQIKEIDTESAAYRRTMLEQSKDFDVARSKLTNRANEELTRKKEELTKARNDLDRMKQRLRKFEAELKVSGPIVLKKLKIKVSHFKQISLVARGQKDLLQERCENLEKALFVISEWIHKELSPHSALPDTLGAQIASSLELTKTGPLIAPEDDFASEYQYELNELKREGFSVQSDLTKPNPKRKNEKINGAVTSKEVVQELVQEDKLLVDSTLDLNPSTSAGGTHEQE